MNLIILLHFISTSIKNSHHWFITIVKILHSNCKDTSFQLQIINFQLYKWFSLTGEWVCQEQWNTKSCNRNFIFKEDITYTTLTSTPKNVTNHHLNLFLHSGNELSNLYNTKILILWLSITMGLNGEAVKGFCFLILW